MYNSLELLSFTQEKNWAVPHFNVHNALLLRGVLMALEETNSPGIISIGYQTLKHVSIESFTAYLKTALNQSSAKVSMHFDHARDIEIIKKSLELGYTSIMFDGSALPMEENIRLTKEVIELARPYNASVEAEIGVVPTPGSAKSEISYTDPEQAKEFFERTKVDFLALSLGSSHGGVTATGSINADLLKEISLDVPYVLHGASGVSMQSIQDAIPFGLRKININTALKIAATKELQRIHAEKPAIDLLEAMEYASYAVKEKAKEYVLLFNSQDKA